MSTISVPYPHLEKLEGRPAHLKRIPRVRVAQIVMDYLAHGWSADEIHRQYPHLRKAEVHSAMAYYFDHTDEIDAEIREEWATAEEEQKRAIRSPVIQRLLNQGQHG